MAGKREDIPPDIAMQDVDPQRDQGVGSQGPYQSRAQPPSPPAHFPHDSVPSYGSVPLGPVLPAPVHPVSGLPSTPNRIPLNGLPTLPQYPISNRHLLLSWANQYCHAPPSYSAMASTSAPWQWPGAMPNQATNSVRQSGPGHRNTRPVGLESHQAYNNHRQYTFVNYYGPDNGAYDPAAALRRGAALETPTPYHIPPLGTENLRNGQILQPFSTGAFGQLTRPDNEIRPQGTSMIRPRAMTAQSGHIPTVRLSNSILPDGPVVLPTKSPSVDAGMYPGWTPHPPYTQPTRPRAYDFVREPVAMGDPDTAAHAQSSKLADSLAQPEPLEQSQEQSQGIAPRASNIEGRDNSVPGNSSHFLAHQEPLDQVSRMKQQIYHEKGVAVRQYLAVRERERTVGEEDKQKAGYPRAGRPNHMRGPHIDSRVVPYPNENARRLDPPNPSNPPQRPLLLRHPHTPQPQPQIASQPPPYRPIGSTYEDYKSSVFAYRINTELTVSQSAYDWVEAIPGLLKELDQTKAYKTFRHITHGYIKDGDYHSVVVLHNASDPFPPSPYPHTTTTFGVYKDAEVRITWVTITPNVCDLVLQCSEMGILTEICRWDFPPRAAELRFHKAYWLLANLQPLGGLLNDATRSFSSQFPRDDDENEECDGLTPPEAEAVDIGQDDEVPEELEPTNDGWEVDPEQEHAACLQLQHPECKIIGFSE